MKVVEHDVANGDGWQLALVQAWDEARLVRGRNPVLIVPGYGMNSFIFSYHPRGTSLVDYLAGAGFEVWRVDMRGQGGARSTGGGDRYGLEDLALTDLRVAVETVLARTLTTGGRVDTIGASLGGTIMFAHIALKPDHRLGSLVAIGSPVRWVDVHPALRLAFASPTVVGLLPFRGTRKLAGIALPFLARRAPSILSIYMNSEITDLRSTAEMIRTVEDPNRHVNRQIAEWIRAGDLILRGVNVTDALRSITAPFFGISALGDGIVPRRTAAFAFDTIASPVKRLLEVGGPELPMAHADLFISDLAERRVFEPLARWLADPAAG